MKLTCASCQQQILLDDNKLPAGVFKVKCPKCGKLVTGQKETPAAQPASPALSAVDELQSAYNVAAAPAPESPAESSENGGDDGPLSPAIQAMVKSEVSRMRREIMAAMRHLFGDAKGHVRGVTDEEDDDDRFTKKALVCEDDQAFLDIITASVKRLGYNIDTARTSIEALKKVDSGSYDLITVDYNFPDDKDGGTKIISRINGQKPAARRETFVVLISANVKSADASAAFFHGANITVNKDEIGNLEALIREGQRRFHEIYSVFNRLLEEKNVKT